MSDDPAAQLAALKSALYRGVLKVRRGDEQIDYQSPDDLRAAIRDLEATIAGRSTGTRAVRPTFSRGHTS